MMARRLSGLFRTGSLRKGSGDSSKPQQPSSSRRSLSRFVRRSTKRQIQDVWVSRLPDGSLGFELVGCIDFRKDPPGVFVSHLSDDCPLSEGARILEINDIDVQSATVAAVKKHLSGSDQAVKIKVDTKPERGDEHGRRGVVSSGGTDNGYGSHSDGQGYTTSGESDTSHLTQSPLLIRARHSQNWEQIHSRSSFAETDPKILACELPLPTMTREEAEAALEGKEAGTYIIRANSGLRLSIMTLDGPRHLVIYTPFEDEFYLFPDQRFSTLFDLVSHYSITAIANAFLMEPLLFRS
ncbi:hypothetical protein PTSG_01425 [Salpingoeca rosetta]|uniref:SH2 domain-containing protein n=1 Tax=Salpingoeca rosetta (strain ATCC 50818 / BSB-021) TaxID=946362 RepID=F2U0B1_SALR5|nr:uncharacterized protein PTSG_01425 [Salpingoeca rosetta]EGD80839.1 hypothetical protein PTSG_01425 [Salpingoeca rosetta]|eukprot:XP_004997400.1 hypothetical protein PTSG_01425 [Salpingoeca rosetta]